VVFKFSARAATTACCKFFLIIIRLFSYDYFAKKPSASRKPFCFSFIFFYKPVFLERFICKFRLLSVCHEANFIFLILGLIGFISTHNEKLTGSGAAGAAIRCSGLLALPYNFFKSFKLLIFITQCGVKT
jgi:hypothetical protein